MINYTPEVLEAVDRWEGIQSAPAAYNRKNIRGIQVLQNNFLERYFATSHWLTPAVWFVPLLSYLLYASITNPSVSHSLTAALVVAGVVAWTLVEYGLHRVVFHYTPRSKGFVRRLIFMTHGYHHEFPSDPRRLVAPPVMSWPLAAIIVPSYYFAAGPDYYAALAAGTVLGYLAYDWVHYYTHHARPKTRVGKFMRRFHMEHHFKDHTTQFGLSSPLWDLVFGTYRRPVEATQKELRILAGEPDPPGPRSQSEAA